jgi:reactive chlorine resistance protein C
LHTERAARALSRWGLVAILVALGAYKFTAVEAEAIRPLVANSPLMGWLYSLGSTRAVSAGVGVAELLIALLLALHRVSPRAGVAGGLGAVAMFVTTLSFVFTTPGVVQNVDALGFLVKDVFLLGAALLASSESLAALARQRG